MPTARGNASVDSRLGSTKIETHLDHMTAANQFGPEYMHTFAILCPAAGRPGPANLGEVALESTIMPACSPPLICKALA